MNAAGAVPPRPDWVRWVAQDSDGTWWGYSEEPLPHDSGWYENEVGRCIRLGVSSPDDWRTTLQAVRPESPNGRISE